MQELEENGFLDKTHASSGRVPSRIGYEFYIKNLITRDETTVELFGLIDDILQRNNMAFDLAIEESIKLLSNITNYTVINIPRSRRQLITQIDLIPTNKLNGVALIVLNTGKVFYHNFSTSNQANLLEIGKVTQILNEILVGHTLAEAREILANQAAQNDGHGLSLFIKHQNQIVDSFINAFNKFFSDDVSIAGVTNILSHPEFKDLQVVKNIYRLLEKDVIKTILVANHPNAIKIGNNMEVLIQDQVVIISIPYLVSEDVGGRLAVMGPLRMDYSRVIPLLEYLATYLIRTYQN
jgi:heat-inducible transcriptional repressor